VDAWLFMQMKSRQIDLEAFPLIVAQEGPVEAEI